MSINKLNYTTTEADLGLRLRMEDLETIQNWVSGVDRYTLASFLAPFSKTKVETSPSTLSGMTGILSVDISSGVTDYSNFRFTTVATDEYMSSPTYADCYVNTTAYGLCRVPMGSSATRNYSINTYWVVYVYSRLSNQVKDVKLRNHYINTENVILFSTSASGATDTLLGTLKIGNPFENGGASLGEIVDGNELKKYNGVRWNGSTANGVATYGGTNSIDVESNLTFDGATLGVVGKVNVANGTVSLPAYSFSSDTNTGFYSIGADQIGVSIGGSGKFSLNTTGFNVSNGNVAVVRDDANAKLTLQNGSEANTSAIISLYKDGQGETTIAQVGTSLMISNNPVSNSIADLTAKANIKIDSDSIDILGTDMTTLAPRSIGGAVNIIAGTGSSGYTGQLGLTGGSVLIGGGTGGSVTAGVSDAGNGGDISIVAGTGGVSQGSSYEDGDGGNVYIAGGNKGGDSANGNVYLNFVGPTISNPQGSLFANLSLDNTSVVYVTYDTTTKEISYGLTTSDSQFKTNLVKINNSIDKINSLNGYTFNFNADAAKIGYTDTTTKYVGVIAQEVEAVMPELVKTQNIPNTTETFKSVDYDKMVALLIEGIKEQQETINALTARIEALEN